MRDITYNRLPRAARTKEVAEKAQSEFAAIQGLRTGDEAPFASYIEQQNLSAHEIKALVKKASQDQFVAKFKALEIPDALRVWRVATPDERSKVSRPLISKMLRKLKDHPEIGRLYMNAADKMGIFDLMGASVPPPEPTPAEEANP